MADIITLIVGSVALYLVKLIVGIVAPYLLDLFDAVAPHLLDPIGRELDFLFHYRSNIEKLREEVDELQKVSEPIKAAWTNAGEIELNVQEWLTSVDEIIKNALKFLEDEKKENEGFFNRLCAWLNLKSWYQKRKKAKQTAAEIVPKIQEGKQLSSSPPPRKIRIPSVEGYEAFESRMPTLKKIMKALSDANVNLIGVYGMGGTGKTVLVKEIARKCEEDKLFDKVVMTIVSQPPNVRKIQGEIADKLNLTLKEETESGRAGRLCEKLKELLVDEKKSILVILDDIWEKLDLAEVGIPFGGNHSGCKILMTSRNRHVLSNEMNTQQDFSIGVLPKKEAWDLFKKTAGDLIEAPELKPIATEIVEECAGLPLVVKAVANALKNKDSSIWRDALVQLKSSGATNIVGIDPKLYSSLKLSYDFLESDEVRSLFLLCCLLPEDYNISIQDFLIYGKGLGLFQGTLKKSRDRAHALVARLKGSCLLLDGNTTESVRVHDVVRDVGISIASKDKNMLIVQNEDRLEEYATEERLRNCPAISLPSSNIQELPKELECPELKFLLLVSKDHSLAISDNFFEGMKQLKVLDLTKIRFSSLPSSLYLLSNLQTLCLDQCMLRDIARIGELKKLEVLCFASSDIAELPREIGQLTCLRLLDLTNCFKLKVIPPNVIEKFTRLEDLYMENSFEGWEVDGNASLAELKDLSLLVTLHIHIPDPNILPKDLCFENLMRYRISIGDGWEWYGDYETSRALKLKLKTSIEQFGLNSLLEKTEDLYLGEMNGNKNGLCSSNREVFPQLRHLHVQEGCEMEYVVNTSELFPDKAFPELRSLFLHNLINLKKICHGQLPTESFSNLRIVEVESCNSLKNLFSLSVVKSLRQLRTLKIKDCEIMDEIVSEGSEASEGNNEAMGKITFPQLHSLELWTLPKLSSFYSKKQTSRPFNNYAPTIDAGSGEIISEAEHDIPTPLFNEKVAFPALEELKLRSMSSMKEIWQDQYHAASFGKLRVLEVRDCESLTHVLTFAIAKSLVQIKSIIVDDCKMMKEVIASEEGEETDETTFSQLNSLKLRNLPNLTSFCTRSNTFSFPSLEEVLVEKCTELKNFSGGILHTPKLDKVHVQSKSKDEWKDVEVLDKGLWKRDLNTTIQYLFVQKVEFLRLFELSELKQICHDQFSVGACYVRYLVVEKCASLLNVVSSNMLESLPKLEKITVESCDSLEQVFDLEGLDCDEKRDGLLPCLEEMNLTELPKLKCIWNKDPKGILTFKNLRRLKINKCNSLRNLSSPSMVPDLWLRNGLEITDCLNMEEIVEKEKGAKEEAIDMIMFYCSSIILQGLPNLSSIYPGNRTLRFPWLNTMKIAGCPRIKTIFTSTNEGLQETFGDGNNDVPSVALFINNKVEFPWLVILELEDLYNIKEIWQGQFHAKSFCNLTTLTVHSCQNLTHLLPFEIAKRLVQIASIIVDGCEMMKDIIEREEGEVADHETTFSQLSSLKLRCLPNLTNFCTGNNTFSFPSLEQVSVEECPKLKIFSNGILNTPKLEKVHLREDEWEWKGDLNTTIQHLFAQK